MSSWTPGYPIDLRSEVMRTRAASGPYGDFEFAATRIVARATGLKVVLQDDNRAPRTPDFRIERDDEIVGIGEIVTTASQPRAALLRDFAAGDLEIESPSLHCSWWLTIEPTANRRRLRESVVQVLAGLEASGAHHLLTSPSSLLATDVPGAMQLVELGVLEAACDPGPREGAGRVIALPPGIGGAYVPDWEECHSWLQQFLDRPVCKRKVDKLNFVAAAQRHLFVGVTWDQPWSILRVLDGDLAEVPAIAPRLPDGVSHLWLWGAEMPTRRCLTFWPLVGWFDASQRWKTA